MNVAAGMLDQRVIIQTQTQLRSDSGAFTPSWTVVATVWASVSYTGSTEPNIGKGRSRRQDITMVIRYRSDVTQGMSMRFNSINYLITGVVPDVRKQYLTLTTEAE